MQTDANGERIEEEVVETKNSWSIQSRVIRVRHVIGPPVYRTQLCQVLMHGPSVAYRKFGMLKYQALSTLHNNIVYKYLKSF